MSAARAAVRAQQSNRRFVTQQLRVRAECSWVSADWAAASQPKDEGGREDGALGELLRCVQCSVRALHSLLESCLSA